MNLKELYIKWEMDSVDRLFRFIIEKLRKDKIAYYLDQYGNKKENEYLQLENINEPSGIIWFKRRNNNPQRWDVSFKELKDAIKLTLRKGSIQRPTDYLHMNGKSNFVGTPLHILISLLENEEYQRNSLVSSVLPHQAFGNVRIDEIDFKTDRIDISFNGDKKAIRMDYWQLEERAFLEVISGPSA